MPIAVLACTILRIVPLSPHLRGMAAAIETWASMSTSPPTPHQNTVQGGDASPSPATCAAGGRVREIPLAGRDGEPEGWRD